MPIAEDRKDFRAERGVITRLLGRIEGVDQRSSLRPSITDDEIRDAALRVIDAHGLDALSVPRIAAAGNFTTAPVYRRFDNAEDVLLDLWSTVLVGHFERLLRATTELARQNLDSDWLIDELLRPSAYSCAVLEAVVTTRRRGIAGYEIRVDVDRLLNSSTISDPELPTVMVLARIAPVLGALLLAPVAPELLVPTIESYPRFATEYHNPAHWKRASADIAYSVPAAPHWNSGDATLDDLRNAVVRVVARYGASGTTVNRIAREAGRSINSAYRRLGNKEELIADAVRLAFRSDFGFSGSENSAAMGFSAEERLRRSLQVMRNHIDPRNRSNRAFTLEALLAARTEPAVRAAVREWLKAGRERLTSGVKALGVEDPTPILSCWEFRIVSGLGALALASASPTVVSPVDPMPALAANDAATFGSLGH